MSGPRPATSGSCVTVAVRSDFRDVAHSVYPRAPGVLCQNTVMTQDTNESSAALRLPPSIVAHDPSDGGVIVTLDASLYPLEALYGAAYIFIDRCYVMLDRPAEGKWSVSLASKKGDVSSQTLRAMAGEFANELLSQAWRLKIGRAHV